MMSDKISLVAVLPDGREHFEDIRPMHGPRADYERVVNNAVRKAGLTSPRANPIQVPVKLFRLEIAEGKLKRLSINTYLVTPPLERMTEAEYNAELADAIGGVFQRNFRLSSASRATTAATPAGMKSASTSPRTWRHGRRRVSKSTRNA